MRTQAANSGAPLPEELLNKPLLESGNVLAYSAWETLFSCRSAPDQPIPWTAVNDYCICYNIDGELREDLSHLVRALDNYYLQYRDERRKAIGNRGGEHSRTDSATQAQGHFGSAKANRTGNVRDRSDARSLHSGRHRGSSK